MFQSTPSGQMDPGKPPEILTLNILNVFLTSSHEEYQQFCLQYYLLSSLYLSVCSGQSI